MSKVKNLRGADIDPVLPDNVLPSFLLRIYY